MSSAPRYGKLWTLQDENLVQTMVDDGIAVETIAYIVQRTPNAIESKIQRAKRRAQMLAEHPC